MQGKVAVIIPVYNEGTVVAKTVRAVLKSYPTVICINDGSSDNSAAEIAKTGAILIEHPINLGQGAALQTGIEFALQFPQIQYFVTLDSDGQHDIKDVKAMLHKLQVENLDVVLGSRFLGRTINIPMGKKILLRVAVRFTNIFSSIHLTDTHNGLRVFNRRFAEQLHITMPGMAHASEILDRIGHGHWRYAEVPVTVSYDNYTKHKGQSMLNSVNIITDLLLKKAHR